MSTQKHVIVTGGSGFIGSHLCEALLARGYAVTALDNFVTGRRENLTPILRNPNFELIEWDVSQSWKPLLEDKKLNLLNKYGLTGVFHFACPASPIDFERIPFEILAVDSLGTMHSVELAMKYGARYLVASTSEVYGDPLVHPQQEDYHGNVNPNGPRACYDEAKRFAEAYVSTANLFKKFNGGIVRIFNTYGPRMRLDDGRIVPELCRQALKGMPLTLHGDGLQTRSFCYVSDLVEGIIRLFETDITFPVNVGNPVERTVFDFAQQVQKLTDSTVPMKYLPCRVDDPKRRCPDITRAKKYLNWEPKVDLEEGLTKTIEYFRTQL